MGVDWLAEAHPFFRADSVFWFAAKGLERSDCVNAQRMLNQNGKMTLCYADNHQGTGCKTKAKFGECEIKLCLKTVYDPSQAYPCLLVAAEAQPILSGGEVGAANNNKITISVEKRDASDGNNDNCGTPANPCKN